MLFYLTQALFQRFAGYTGTSLYESWSLSMFNTLFTSLPVIFMGIFEKDLSPSTLLAVPELYTIGHTNGGFNLIIYAGWVFMASIEAVLVYFLMYSIYGRAGTDMSVDLYSMVTLTFTACVIAIVTKVQFLELHNKTVTCVLAMVLGVGGWWLFNVVLSALYGKNIIYDVRGALFYRFGRDATWWLTLVVIIFAIWALEVSIRCLKRCWAQTDVEVFQELEKDPFVKQRFKQHASGSASKKNRVSLSRRPSDWVEETRIKNRAVEQPAEDQAKREIEVEELLRRPRVMFAESGAGVGVRRRQHSESEIRSDDIALTDMRKEDEAPIDEKRDKGHTAASLGAPPSSTRTHYVREALRGALGGVRKSLEGAR